MIFTSQNHTIQHKIRCDPNARYDTHVMPTKRQQNALSVHENANETPMHRRGRVNFERIFGQNLRNRVSKHNFYQLENYFKAVWISRLSNLEVFQKIVIQSKPLQSKPFVLLSYSFWFYNICDIIQVPTYSVWHTAHLF